MKKEIFPLIIVVFILGLSLAIYFIFFKESKEKKFAKAVKSRDCNRLGVVLPEINKYFADEFINSLSDNELVYLLIEMDMKASTREANIYALQQFRNDANNLYNDCSKV